MIEVRLALPVVPGAADGVPAAKPGAAAAGSDPPQFPGRRVLVADDSEINQQILSAMLARSQIETTCVGNGADAVALWREAPFDLMFFDISMPVMDGMAALALMREEAARKGAPGPRIVASTANVMAEHRDTYRRAGFVGVLAKPFRMEELYAILGEHLP
jgi:CheY-like chemotaxis protein